MTVCTVKSESNVLDQIICIKGVCYDTSYLVFSKKIDLIKIFEKA